VRLTRSLEGAASLDALANPQALEAFVDFARDDPGRAAEKDRRSGHHRRLPFVQRCLGSSMRTLSQVHGCWRSQPVTAKVALAAERYRSVSR
jgi:hypothetical protein